MGIACGTAGLTAEDLVRQADAAMYDVKRGRTAPTHTPEAHPPH